MHESKQFGHLQVQRSQGGLPVEMVVDLDDAIRDRHSVDGPVQVVFFQSNLAGRAST